MASDSINAIFVYGTLQRGEVRESCWPYLPQSIEWATVQGQLRDLGEYPALVLGEDVVLGEVWSFESSQMERTLACLDEIEWFGQDDHDLYVRRVVTCRSLVGSLIQAFAYWFANPDELNDMPIVLPDAEGYCRWTAARSQL